MGMVPRSSARKVQDNHDSLESLGPRPPVTRLDSAVGYHAVATQRPTSNLSGLHAGEHCIDWDRWGSAVQVGPRRMSKWLAETCRPV